MPRVQGGGDHASARRYNSRTRRFVERTPRAATASGGGVDDAALRKARSKARDAGQDARDARVFRSKTAGKTAGSGRGKQVPRSRTR